MHGLKPTVNFTVTEYDATAIYGSERVATNANASSTAWEMILTFMAGIAEFERSLISDRTRNGREAGKASGVKFGPRPTLTPAQIEHGRRLINQRRFHGY